MSDTARLKRTLFITNLNMAVTPKTLHEAFIPFGEIEDISLPKPDLPSSKDPHRGFGYVEFELEDDAEEAIYNMNESELYGQYIRVTKAKERKTTGDEGLGSKIALWNQESWIAQNQVKPEDRTGADGEDDLNKPADPMEGLEGLDVAGPKPA